ncbi:LysR family transcriptional regulator [Plasticicumulans acidivorans]|uniref:DNA-binding transcriptional LysR family regulator n=1 Tax=Plasticicumulans acidivorans TaxID=886464 RepID=A0A317MZ50_9GAMM|nr:LysR family transcriptional regulator [Plasticicumulans acidivorans]PWV64711.1 DNA-binding transcriptional LysR family regulator [Plasticicumulans acidivorans]
MVQKSTERPLHWEDVRYFAALARHGSLTRTARELAVEHSTVARRIEALEKTLGVRLFDRLPRRWQLTAEGEQLAVQAQRLEDEALAFARAAFGVATLNGSVRLSAPPTLASHFLVPRLGRLRQLGDFGFGLYGTADWLGCEPAACCFLGYDESLRHAPQQQWLEAIAQGRRFALRSNDLTTLHHAAAAGLGLAALPHFVARDDPRLHAVPNLPAAPRRPIWLVMHAELRRSPRVRAVADVLIELFGEAGEALG